MFTISFLKNAQYTNKYIAIHGIISTDEHLLIAAVAYAHRYKGSADECGHSFEYYNKRCFRIFPCNINVSEQSAYPTQYYFTLQQKELLDNDQISPLACENNAHYVEIIRCADNAAVLKGSCILNKQNESISCVIHENASLSDETLPDPVSEETVEQRKQEASEMLYSDEGFMNDLLDMYGDEDEINDIMSELEAKTDALAASTLYMHNDNEVHELFHYIITVNPDSLKNSVL